MKSSVSRNWPLRIFFLVFMKSLRVKLICVLLWPFTFLVTGITSPNLWSLRVMILFLFQFQRARSLIPLEGKQVQHSIIEILSFLASFIYLNLCSCFSAGEKEKFSTSGFIRPFLCSEASWSLIKTSFVRLLIFKKNIHFQIEYPALMD